MIGLRLPGYSGFKRLARPMVDATIAGDTRVLLHKRDKRGNPIALSDGSMWRLGEHITIYGMTGSGKTTLIKNLIKAARRANPRLNIYILDTKKDEDDFPKWPGKIAQFAAPAVHPTERGAIQIWQPRGESKDMREQVSAWFTSILRAKQRALVVVNDLKDISPRPEVAPDGLPDLLRDGRSFGISTVSCTQEAAYCAREIHNQITYAIRMLMTDPYDISKVHRLQGGVIPSGSHMMDIPQPPKFGFYVSRLDVAPRVIRYFPNQQAWP